MSEINILSPHVADLIAAGEVVERPASVVKELMENSFDAGARNITVEIRSGGMALIRVTDDGGGMLPEDAGLCFQRHATSKLKDERGLERIGTMGFRGEALAAISAVSRIELITRKKDADEGARVLMDGGELRSLTPCGCPAGASMVVRDLFFNTPARQKFMKSDRAESGACVLTALRCALGRPEVSVRMLRDGDEEFFSPGDGRADSCVYSLLGRETAAELLPISGGDESVSVSGFTGEPRHGHGNRQKQFFFVNGRPIRSLMLQSAVEQAYKNTLLVGKFPSCVIYLTLSPSAVDVNVHPAKTEVRFREERAVFDNVYYSVLSALEGGAAQAHAPSPAIPAEPPRAASAPKKDFYRSMTAAEFKQKYPAGDDGGRTAFTGSGTTLRQPSAPYGSPRSAPHLAAAPKNPPVSEAAHSAGVPAAARQTGLPLSDSGAQETAPAASSDWRLVGEAMKTYIIVERGDELILIDKHAAHERMIFDALKAQGREVMSQGLLSPILVKLGVEDAELLEKHLPQLYRLGFELDIYGEDAVMVRGVPADTDAGDVPSMLEEICGSLKNGGGLSPEDALDEILHSVACKAAIKAGWKTDSEELLTVAREVLSGRVSYCPHGRPVSVTITKKQLDRDFSRIV